MYKVFTKLVGNLFVPGGQELLKDLKSGQQLDLVRESDNQYDKNAIRVEANGNKIGYLGAHVARELAPRIDAEEMELYCYVAQITGGGDKNYGCNLILTDEEVNVDATGEIISSNTRPTNDPKDGTKEGSGAMQI